MDKFIDNAINKFCEICLIELRDDGVLVDIAIRKQSDKSYTVVNTFYPSGSSGQTNISDRNKIKEMLQKILPNYDFDWANINSYITYNPVKKDILFGYKLKNGEQFIPSNCPIQRTIFNDLSTDQNEKLNKELHDEFLRKFNCFSKQLIEVCDQIIDINKKHGIERNIDMSKWKNLDDIFHVANLAHIVIKN